MAADGLSLVAVDGEPSALAALVQMLAADPRVERVTPAGDALAALRIVRREPVDAVLLNVTVPGMGGIELGSLLARLTAPPAVVYVAATSERAVEAFDVGALDYLVQPVEPERLARSVARISTWRAAQAAYADDLPALPVEAEGRTVLVRREDVRFVEAQGDYVRIHTDRGEHLFRMPLSRLALSWSRAGFVRIHRGYLVSLRHVRELRNDPLGGVRVRVAAGGGTTRDLPVSRRHVRGLKQRLTGATRRPPTGR